MTDDARYLQIVTEPIRRSAHYRPKFGKTTRREGASLSEFLDTYGADPFYTWFGLDDPLLYAAHKAAGGMTSVYRQIGLGCERLFRAVLQDTLDLSDDDARWFYEVATESGKRKRLHLDARIPIEAVADADARRRITAWLRDAAAAAEVDAAIGRELKGVVFEVRQGYKSKDPKRQNADLANAAAAYARAWLPCLILLSTQIDEDVAQRYRVANWILLTGTPAHGNPHSSSYAFMGEVVGYDLAGFFSRNRGALRSEVTNVLVQLLDPAS